MIFDLLRFVGIKVFREDKVNIIVLCYFGNVFFWLYYIYSVNDNFEIFGWFCNWCF